MKDLMADENVSTQPTFAPGGADHPLSPHLQIWRWTITMATSILQRATGIALYAGSALLVLWLFSAAVSDGFYKAVTGFLGSPFGLFILVGFTWAQMFHMCNGIKYLIWDSGSLLELKTAKTVAWTVLLSSFALTALIWAVALAVKG